VATGTGCGGTDDIVHEPVDNFRGVAAGRTTVLAMAHLDIDTDVLVAARTRLDAAAAALADARTGFGPANAEAAGDAALASAVVDLFTAWAPSHQALTGTLKMLATALGHAASAFEGAECVTADGLAGLLVPSPSASAGPRADWGV
jgi:hypothetical protein